MCYIERLNPIHIRSLISPCTVKYRWKNSRFPFDRLTLFFRRCILSVIRANEQHRIWQAVGGRAHFSLSKDWFSWDLFNRKKNALDHIAFAAGRWVSSTKVSKRAETDLFARFAEVLIDTEINIDKSIYEG